MRVNVLPHRAPLTAIMTVGLYLEISNQTRNILIPPTGTGTI